MYSIFFYCNKFLQSQYVAPKFYLHKKVPKSRIKKGSSISNQKRFLINSLKGFSIIMGWIVIYLLKVLKYTNSKQKILKQNAAPLCLGNASKDFSVDNTKKTGLWGYVYNFSVDYDSIDVDDILDIWKYLMKKHKVQNVWIY